MSGLYNYRWQQARLVYLRAHPLCTCHECVAGKRLRLANVVDHIVPHRGDTNLFWDEANWQAMNKRCHDIKTAGEDGGFGNSKGKGSPGPACGADGIPTSRRHHWAR